MANPGIASDQYNYTLAEVAEELGISGEGVRKIEQRALEKVRLALEARGINSTALDEDYIPQIPGPL